MDEKLQQLRNRTHEIVLRMQMPINRHLPLADTPTFIRPVEDIFKRLLAIHLSLALSCELDPRFAANWLRQEGLGGYMTTHDETLLKGKVYRGWTVGHACLLNQAWALAWVLGLEPADSFWGPIPDDFVNHLPDPSRDESSSVVREKVKLRDTKSIIAEWDLAYCLNWAVHELRLQGRPLPKDIDPLEVIERRRALEYVLSDEDWDNVPMDT